MKQTSKLVGSLLLLCNTSFLFAQPSDSIDTGHYIVAYDHTIRTTDATGNPVEEVCRLAAICGTHVTYQGEYYHTLMEMASDRSKEIQLAEFSAREKNLPTILIGYPTGKMTTIDKIIPQRYTVDGNQPQIDWQIAEDTMTISGYACQKAVGHYAGRTWVCWYTESVPLLLGPWKLGGGLPGLIVMAHDADNIHQFQFCGLIKRDVTIRYAESNRRKHISQSDFIKQRNRILCDKRYAADPRYYLTEGTLEGAVEMWAGGPEPDAAAKQTVLAQDMVVPKRANVYQPLELE